MSAVASGWWRDERREGIAHFYDQADALDIEFTCVWTKCGAETRLAADVDPRVYLAMPGEDDEPRPFVDMGSANGKACPECLKKLQEAR